MTDAKVLRVFAPAAAVMTEVTLGQPIFVVSYMQIGNTISGISAPRLQPVPVPEYIHSGAGQTSFYPARSATRQRGLLAGLFPITPDGATSMDHFDIPGLVAGFALSLVIGAVLYVYLTVG